MGPKEIATAFEIKETVVSRRGIGPVAASGSGIKTTGRKRSFVTRRMEKELV